MAARRSLSEETNTLPPGEDPRLSSSGETRQLKNEKEKKPPRKNEKSTDRIRIVKDILLLYFFFLST